MKQVNLALHKFIEVANVLYVLLTLFLGVTFFSDADNQHIPLLAFVTIVWSICFVYLEAKNHTIIAINSTILFWLYVVGDIITYDLSEIAVVSYAFLIIGLSFIYSLLYQELSTRVKYIASATAISISVVLYAIPLFYIVYYLNFGIYVTPEIFYAIMQTNVTEAIEFVRIYVDRKWIILIAISSVVLMHYMYKLETRDKHKINVFIIVAVVIVSFSMALYDKKNLRIVYMLTKTISHYEDELNAFKDIQEKRKSGEIEFDAIKKEEGEVYIVVIGESLNKNHMSLYGYVRNTTPHLINMSKKENFLVYKNAYSNHTQTMPVLSQLLTEANQRNGKNYFDSLTVIDVFKEAGIETIWVTNQVMQGVDDNLSGVIAAQADELYRINYEFGATSQTQKFDGEMIEIVDEILGDEANDNRVVFVHLMGNHGDYCSRFPREYEKFTGSLENSTFGSAVYDEDLEKNINCYDNSVLYNDYVVSSLIKILSAYDGVSGLIYVPDHADDVLKNRGHNSGMFTFSMTDIPMLMWFSDDYKDRYSNKYSRLYERQSYLFTNDLIYDTLIGILGVNTSHIDDESDLSGDDYFLEASSSYTLHGRVPITSKDNYHYWLSFNQDLIMNSGLSDKVIPHRVNSSGKLSQVIYDNYHSFELDVMFFDDANGGRFEVGHDVKTRSGVNLDEFLNILPVSAIEKIWFDVKNINDKNIYKVANQLKALDAKYELKDRIIVESDMTSENFRVISEEGFHASYYLPGDLARLYKENDRDELIKKAREISEQVKRQRCAAVSFDIRLYPFVKGFLEDKLDSGMVYHTWDLSIELKEPDFFDILETQSYYGDDRIKTILVRYYSEFDL